MTKKITSDRLRVLCGTFVAFALIFCLEIKNTIDPETTQYRVQDDEKDYF